MSPFQKLWKPIFHLRMNSASFLLKEPDKGPLNANLLTIKWWEDKPTTAKEGGFSMGPQQLPRYYRNKNPPTDSIFWGNPLPLPRMQNSAVASMNLLIAWDAPKSHTKVKGSPRVTCQWLVPSWGMGWATWKATFLSFDEVFKRKAPFESNPGISKNKTYPIKINFQSLPCIRVFFMCLI